GSLVHPSGGRGLRGALRVHCQRPDMAPLMPRHIGSADPARRPVIAGAQVLHWRIPCRRTPMKRICCLLFALLPVVAMAYPIEVAKQFNGAEISVTTQEIDHNMAALMLYNYGQAEAQCTAIFRNGPEAP